MSKIIVNLAKAVALLIGVPAVGLFAYDMIAVRRHLDQIHAALAQANPDDSSPPKIICQLIDANAGSPTPHATRLVISLVYSDLTQGQWHVRSVLWRILLPMHFDKPKMYGLYSKLSYNGTDHGLSNFANREFGKPLSQLTPMQAATTVAITRAPTIYLTDRARLAERAKVLLDTSRHAP